MKAPALVLLAALTLKPACAHAAKPAASVNDAFGNTLLTIDPDGRSRKIWLRSDGAWTGLSRRGLDLAGKWKAEGGKVCLSQSKPFLPGSLCQQWPSDLSVGGADVKDPSGKSGKIRLVKGRVTR